MTGRVQLEHDATTHGFSRKRASLVTTTLGDTIEIACRISNQTPLGKGAVPTVVGTAEVVKHGLLACRIQLENRATPRILNWEAGASEETVHEAALGRGAIQVPS